MPGTATIPAMRVIWAKIESLGLPSANVEDDYPVTNGTDGNRQSIAVGERGGPTAALGDFRIHDHLGRFRQSIC